MSAQNGVADFDDLTLNHAGQGYTLKATSDNAASTTTSSITVTDRLLVSNPPPANVIVDKPFDVAVQAVDANDTVDSDFSGTVNFALANDPNGDTSLGGNQVSATEGTADFSNLTVDEPGQGFTIQASGARLDSVTTPVFDVLELKITAPNPDANQQDQQFCITPGDATTAPAMPMIPVIADVEGTSQDLSMVVFTWKAQVVSQSVHTDHTYTSQRMRGTNGTLTNDDMWGNLIYGGIVTLTVCAHIGGLTLISNSVSFKIQGSNPSTDDIEQYIALHAPTPPGWTTIGISRSYQTIMDQIIAKESSFYQFKKDGLPLPNGGNDGGFGLAQPTPISDDQQLWNWQTNVTAGIAKLNSNVANELVYSGKQEAKLSTYLTTNQFSEVDFAILTPEMSLEDIIQQYQGGHAWLLSSMAGMPLNPSPNPPVKGQTLSINWKENFKNLQPNGKTYWSNVLGKILSNYNHPTDPGDPLVVTTQPPSTVGGGTEFGLVITAENLDGSVNTFFNGDVSLSLNEYDNLNGALVGTLTMQAVNGVATFTGLTINQAGLYSLTVNSDGIQGTVTNLFNIQPGPASQLVATIEPMNNYTVGARFDAIISAEDTYGNADAAFNGLVTITLKTNPGNGTLGGNLTVQAINGIATFFGLTIDSPGNGYIVQATANDITSAR